VLENSGGTILEHGLRSRLELHVVLRAGVGIASALGRFHAHGFIHRNLNPGNVFINFETGEARLIGVYIAPRWPVGGPEAPETGGANFAFLAPEQTGRMNRPADPRSDLYAFGVMLYKMATGELPFMAKDPMEWFHCHLAVQPIPPNQRAATVPAQLSAIVMKLLSKVPEERYQTAAGVEKDLTRCFERLESDGQIAPFPLGTDDVPDQLLISQKVYGRDSQIDTLLTAFKRVASGGNPELVLVSGYSGIGKSTMVDQLPNQVASLGGLFASGKFDQLKKDLPYGTVVQAFQMLVRQILSKSEDEVSQWRDRLAGALGENGRLITNLLPELELIIGKQSAVPDLPPQDAHHRFEITFGRFLSVFAGREHPLALFLDDLQWADSGTLHFLEHLLAGPEVQSVLLIGAYRENETNASDPLDRSLEKLRNIGIEVSEIALAPLSPGDLTELVVDSLHANSDRARLLAQLIHEKTGGNPFFAIQFLKALAEEQLLLFDPASASWTWDLEEIHTRGFTDNVAELVVEKLERLPNATLEILKLLACLGSSAAISTISFLSGKSCEVLEASVSEAIRAGLVSKHNGCLKFLHDRVQEAAYELIPNADRVSEHLRIGQSLLKQLAPDRIEESIFEIVNQLNRGAAQLVSAGERARLADLNLIAAKRAKAAAAYVSALNYLAICSELLSEDSWQARYETCFLVVLNTAECELLTSRFTIAEERLTRLSTLAKNPGDRAPVASLRVILYQTLNRCERAVEICLEYLSGIGVPCSRNPTEYEVN
jgi:predicted ATPase